MIYLATYVYDQCLILGHLQLSVLYLWTLISLLLSVSAARWHHHATRSERIKQRRAGWLSFPWGVKLLLAHQRQKHTCKVFRSIDYNESGLLPALGTFPLQLNKPHAFNIMSSLAKFLCEPAFASVLHKVI